MLEAPLRRQASSALAGALVIMGAACSQSTPEPASGQPDSNVAGAGAGSGGGARASAGTPNGGASAPVGGASASGGMADAGLDGAAIDHPGIDGERAEIPVFHSLAVGFEKYQNTGAFVVHLDEFAFDGERIGCNN